MVNDYASPDAKKIMGNVHPDNVFNLNNGSSIKSIKELYSALQNMETGTFSHHVNNERNDFSSWVRDIHKDYKLANSLSSAKNKDECAKAVASRIYEVQRAVEQKKSVKVEERKTSVNAAVKPTPEVKPAKEVKKTEENVKKKEEKPKPRKKSRFSETETAAERLEKILNDAVKAKMDKRKEKAKAVKKDKDAGSSKVVDIDAGKVFDFERPKSQPRIRNEPFALKANKKKEETKAKVAKVPEPKAKIPAKPTVSAIEEKVEEPPIEELFSEKAPAPADPCEELISFAEEKTDPQKVASEVSSIFSKSSLKVFKDDMKKMFASGNPAEEMLIEEPEPPEPPEEEVATAEEVEEVKEIKEPKAEKADTKAKMLSHLKRVYK
jgi:hypothetical protein